MKHECFTKTGFAFIAPWYIKFLLLFKKTIRREIRYYGSEESFFPDRCYVLIHKFLFGKKWIIDCYSEYLPDHKKLRGKESNHKIRRGVSWKTQKSQRRKSLKEEGLS